MRLGPRGEDELLADLKPSHGHLVARGFLEFLGVFLKSQSECLVPVLGEQEVFEDFGRFGGLLFGLLDLLDEVLSKAELQVLFVQPAWVDTQL